MKALVVAADALAEDAEAWVVRATPRQQPSTHFVLACRHHQLNTEIQDLKGELERLIQKTAPVLVEAFGVGPDTAAALLIAAGSNPDRLHSEAAFASLCGVSPVPASSGKTNRHRLNRGGDRQANAALYRIVVVRLRHDLRTQAYLVFRRRNEPEVGETLCGSRSLLDHPEPYQIPDKGLTNIQHPYGDSCRDRQDRASLGHTGVQRAELQDQ